MNQHRVSIDTSYGRIILELESEKVPLTVGNFVQYIEEGFYDNTLFHRVIDNFIIQGGGFEPGLIQKTTRTPIKNESSQGLHNKRGTIAMARLPDEPDSATSQFFINTRDNDILDYNAGDNKQGYCAFGRVVDGMEVVERIEGVGTATVGEHHDVPLKEIVIEKVELINTK
ncbi:MAG: peptidylprolyl isomerase [Arenicellales bacterium]|nr:peptidylprolyl isomerase [Arenicellales bacterium]